ARPGGNITGVGVFGTPLVAKRLELLREVAPAATVIGMLVNPNNPNAKVQLSNAQEAAARFGVHLIVLPASAERDFDTALATLVEQRVVALLIGVDSFLTSRRDKIVGLALQHRVPAIYQNREFVLAGGLMSYHASFADGYRVMGSYTGRILKGEKPADLPVYEASQIELMINLKSAKTLGITIPPSLLARADEVISPILANVYLHYAYDLWVHRWRHTKATGDVIVVRFADDTIVGFEHEHEARDFLQDLHERL